MGGGGSYHSHYHPAYRPKPQFRGRLPPEFAILLKYPPFKDPKPLAPRAIDDLIASLPSPPKAPLVFPSRGGLAGERNTAAKLVFPSASDALDAIASLWRRRLDGAHFLVPVIDSHDASLKEDELQLVKKLTIEHAERLLDGEAVNEWRRKTVEIERDIKKKKGLLGRRPNKSYVALERFEETERLEVELQQINGKLEEFWVSIRSILSYLNKGKDMDLEVGEFDVFKFGRYLDLHGLVRIQSMLMRECRRLSDGLPIYAWRRELLRTMYFNQVH